MHAFSTQTGCASAKDDHDDSEKHFTIVKIWCLFVCFSGGGMLESVVIFMLICYSFYI